MLKKLISLLLVLCLLGSSVGCGGGYPVGPPNNEESADEIIYIQDTNLEDNVLAVAGKDEGEALAVLGEKDALGNPIKITGAVYISEQGEAFIIDAGDDGLPTYILDSAGNKIVFTNYTDSTVDISIFNSNNELIEGPTTITVSPSDLATLKQLYSSIDLKNKDAAEVIAFVLRWGGFGVGWAVCVAAAISLVPPAILIACGSALLSTAAIFIPGDADSLILSQIGVIKCALVSTPWDIVACAGSIMSFIGTIIDIINQSEEILTAEEIELIREWGYGGDYVVRWPDGYVDVYDATDYSQMQGILNQWNAAIGGPVILRLSSNPNCPVKVIFDSNIGQEGYCWNANIQEGDDYTFSEVMIKINYDESFCGYPNTTYTAYLCAFNAVAGFNYWAEVSLTPLDDWNNFNTIPDTIKTMVHALYKVSPGYHLGDSKQWKNRSNAIIKSIFKSGGGSYLDGDRK